MSVPTFEEVDKHLKKLKVSAPPANQAEAGAQLCEIYHNVRPMLVLLLSIPLIPPKWKAVADSFLGVLDMFCPAAPVV